jgi:hypothetical protein
MTSHFSFPLLPHVSVLEAPLGGPLGRGTALGGGHALPLALELSPEPAVVQRLPAVDRPVPLALLLLLLVHQPLQDAVR